MKITKGEHYFVRAMGSNIKVEVSDIIHDGQIVLITVKTEGGTEFIYRPDDLKKMIESAAAPVKQINEIEI